MRRRIRLVQLAALLRVSLELWQFQNLVHIRREPAEHRHPLLGDAFSADTQRWFASQLN